MLSMQAKDLTFTKGFICKRYHKTKVTSLIIQISMFNILSDTHISVNLLNFNPFMGRQWNFNTKINGFIMNSVTTFYD